MSMTFLMMTQGWQLFSVSKNPKGNRDILRVQSVWGQQSEGETRQVMGGWAWSFSSLLPQRGGGVNFCMQSRVCLLVPEKTIASFEVTMK